MKMKFAAFCLMVFLGSAYADASFIVDTEAPVAGFVNITANTTGRADWTITELNNTLNASDFTDPQLAPWIEISGLKDCKVTDCADAAGQCESLLVNDSAFPWRPFGTGIFSATLNSTEGVRTVRIICRDNADNIAVQMQDSIGLDLNNPYATISYFLGNTTNTSLQINQTRADTGPAPSGWNASATQARNASLVNGTESAWGAYATIDTSGGNFVFAGTSCIAYQFRHQSTDTAWRVSGWNQSGIVWIDTGNPVSSFGFPAAGSWFNSSFNVSFADSDACSGLTTCYYRILNNGTQTLAWTARTCAANITVNVATQCSVNGPNSCAVEAYGIDGTGRNSTLVQRNFSIDTLAPTWTNAVVNQTTIYKNDTIGLNATWNDGGSGLNYYIFSTNQTGSWVNSTAIAFSGTVSNYTIVITASKATVVGWMYYANDSYGFKNQTAIQTFTVQNKPPTTPTALTPTSGTYGGTQNIVAVNCSGSFDIDGDAIRYQVQSNDTTTWHFIGNHTVTNIYAWNVTPISTQTNVDLQCLANDSTNISSYYNPAGTLTIDNTVPSTSDNATTAWRNTDMLVGLTCTDTGSSCNVTKYCNDTTNACTPTTVYTTPITISCTAGTTCASQYIRYLSNDTVNNVESVKSSVQIRIDKNATLTTDNAPTAWRNTDATVTLTCSDTGGSGCNVTLYCNDTSGACTPTTAYSAPITISCTAGSTCPSQYVRYFSNDSAGNIETTRTSGMIRIDKTPASSSDNATTAWRSTDEIVGLSCTDTSGSGCNTTYYCNDTAGTCTNLGIYSTPITISCLAGTTCPAQYIRYNSSDMVGNTETIHTSPVIKIDKQAPVTTDDSVNTCVAIWQTVAFSCNDGTGSGCASTKFCVDTTGTCTPTTVGISTSINCAAGEYCEQYVRYLSNDSVGNTETAHNSLLTRIDKAGPTVPTALVPASGTYTNDSTPDLSWTASTDNGCSSVSQYNITVYASAGCTGTMTYSVLTASVSQTTTTISDGTYYWKVMSKDVLGNWGNWSSCNTIVIDVTAPTPINVTNAPASWTNATISAAVSCSDALSGCNATTYRIYSTASSGACPAAYATYTLSSPQSITATQYLCAAAKDNAGNVGYQANGMQYMVDQIAPGAVTINSLNYYKTGYPTLNWTTATDTGGSGINRYYGLIANNSPSYTLYAGQNLSGTGWNFSCTSCTNYTIPMDANHTCLNTSLVRGLCDERWHFRMWVTDNAGNQGPYV